MRLVRLKLTGYRRFEDASVTLGGKLIALIGPNQAGKTSLLQALHSLSNNVVFKYTDLTKTLDDPNDLVLEAHYLIESSDRKTLQQAPDANNPRWLVQTHEYTGASEYALEPGSDDTQINNAIPQLALRLPRFVWFDEESRQLSDTYELTAIANNAPPALTSLLKLSGVTARQLLNEAVSSPPRLSTLLSRANFELSGVFRDIWNESGTAVSFQVNGTTLHLQIVNESGEFASMSETSDGLRTFVALIAFVKFHGADDRTVLLVDEMESHLHYDAQADLMNALRVQRDVRQIIYSTHSAGCLPQDLGTQVKAVVPNRATGRSTISNSIWTLGQGMGAVMLGMGATVFAFSPVRKAVVGEGATETILLPALLREVMAVEDLEFQVVSGVAQVNEHDVEDLDFEARRVVYVIDSDDGGRAHGEKLRDAHINSERIIEIGLGQIDGLALEDVLDPAVYLDAVNTELQLWQNVELPLSPRDLERVGRASAINDACEKLGVKAPGKVHVAARLAEFAIDRRLASDKYVEHLRELFRAITDALNSARRTDE